uniref:NADH dehydrogenase subunit 2 n=1 Tax=Erragonalia choui TaxID=700820 RepID=UPI0022FD4107|nr:NADH dehydrogenase subunit 2 [Erragonalia choui]WAP91658.1 NADH dehydrogenase subunit 2 [Erragonalia choui]
MMLNSIKLLFYTTMIIGIMVCICSNNWMMMWSGLEISLMSFLPLMISMNLLSSECMMKYFIIQSLSSSILLLGMMLILMNKSSNFIMLISLMLKIGMSPFHNWVLNVIEGLSFKSIFFLLTFMKISPMMVMSYLSKMLWMPVLLSLIVGAIMGINQNSLRKILGYSSIFNIGFSCSCINEMSLWLMYMLVYSFMLICMIIMINKLNIFYINQIMINEFNLKTKISFWLMMMSFGGIPPMLGFLSKLMLFEFMILNNQVFLLMIMLLTSLIVMFYYIRMTYLSIMFSSMMMKWNFMSINNSFMVISLINSFMLFMVVFIKSLI